MKRQLRWARGEEGASLVLALAFMSLFGVFAGLLAQFGAASFKTTTSVRDQRSSVYAAEGAVDTAIDYVRRIPSLGINGGACLSGATTMSLGTVVGHGITATCTGQPSAVGGVSANLPPQALLTTATGNEDGINIGAAWFNATARISGGVFSNNGISTNDILGIPSALSAGSAPVTARGACGAVTGNPVTCNVGAASHPEGNDPNYPSPLSTVPSHQTVPACGSAANKVYKFSPGFYDDEAGLTALTDGHCSNATLWFQPGAYYFDFDLAGGGNVWYVTDQTVNIVGGTPKGWSPTSPGPPTVPIPGSCKVDTDPAPNAGVQFVWGGDSNWQLASGDVELCAAPDANGRELALYGQTTGAATLTTLTLTTTGLSGTPTKWPNSFSPVSTINGTPNSNPCSPSGACSTASLTSSGSSASITLQGYTLPSSVTSMLSSNKFDFAANPVQLRIAHRESVINNVGSLTATVIRGDGSSPAACTWSVDTPSFETTSLRSNTVDVPAGCITDPSQLVGMKVTYAGSRGAASVNLDLDGIEVLVKYTPPTLRAESGCILVPGGWWAQGSGACSLVALTSAFGGEFYVNGTVYAPLARLDLESTFSTHVQLTRGVIVRSIGIWDPPWATSTTPMISVPPSGRTVAFVGYVDNVRRVRAVANFVDNPTPGSDVDVTSWSVTR